MNKQWPEEKKIKLSHFVINNNNIEDTVKQVQYIHNELLKSSSSSKI